MKLGIVGLPNVGKITLCSTRITNAGAESANYPFCTIDPNVGVVAVPDARPGLAQRRCISRRKTTPAVIEFVDIAGLVKGASQGRGPGQQVPRPTSASTTPSSMWCAALTMRTSSTWRASTDPIRDMDIIDLELIMADVEMVDRRIDKAQKAAKARQEVPPRGAGVRGTARPGSTTASPPAPIWTRSTRRTPPSSPPASFLSLKPVIYAANLDEDGFADPAGVEYYKQVKADRAAAEGAQVHPGVRQAGGGDRRAARRGEGHVPGGSGHRPSLAWTG